MDSQSSIPIRTNWTFGFIHSPIFFPGGKFWLYNAVGSSFQVRLDFRHHVSIYIVESQVKSKQTNKLEPSDSPFTNKTASQECSSIWCQPALGLGKVKLQPPKQTDWKSTHVENANSSEAQLCRQRNNILLWFCLAKSRVRQVPHFTNILGVMLNIPFVLWKPAIQVIWGIHIW